MVFEIYKTQLVGCLTIHGLENQRPERLPEGYLLHFPTSKSLDYFLKKGGREWEGTENPWKIGETGWETVTSSILKRKVFLKRFQDLEHWQIIQVFSSLLRFNRCLYYRNIFFSLSLLFIIWGLICFQVCGSPTCHISSLGGQQCCYYHSSLDCFTLKDLPLKDAAEKEKSVYTWCTYPVLRIPPDRRGAEYTTEHLRKPMFFQSNLESLYHCIKVYH